MAVSLYLSVHLFVCRQSVLMVVRAYGVDHSVRTDLLIIELCCCVVLSSWCQRDMMPVYHAHNSGSYTASVSNGEYDLVFAGYKPTSKL